MPSGIKPKNDDNDKEKSSVVISHFVNDDDVHMLYNFSDGIANSNSWSLKMPALGAQHPKAGQNTEQIIRPIY